MLSCLKEILSTQGLFSIFSIFWLIERAGFDPYIKAETVGNELKKYGAISSSKIWTGVLLILGNLIDDVNYFLIQNYRKVELTHRHKTRTNQ